MKQAKHTPYGRGSSPRTKRRHKLEQKRYEASPTTQISLAPLSTSTKIPTHFLSLPLSVPPPRHLFHCIDHILHRLVRQSRIEIGFGEREGGKREREREREKERETEKEEAKALSTNPLNWEDFNIFLNKSSGQLLERERVGERQREIHKQGGRERGRETLRWREEERKREGSCPCPCPCPCLSPSH